MKIITGFLTGNLLNDTTNIDIDASAKRYAELLHDAIASEFPQADIIIRWQSGEGSIPYDLQTAIYFSPDCCYDDAVENITEHVNWIADKVWQSFEWIIYASGTNG